MQINKNLRIYLKVLKILVSVNSKNKDIFAEIIEYIEYLSNELKIGIKNNIQFLKYKNIAKEKDLF